MIDALAGPDAAEDVFLFIGPFGRNDKGNVSTDGLLRGVAEESLGGGIPTLDDAVQVLADDGIVGRIDDRRQVRASQFRTPAVGNIDEDVHGPNDLSPFILQWSGVGQGGPSAAVGAFDDDFKPALRLAVPQRESHPALVMRHG